MTPRIADGGAERGSAPIELALGVGLLVLPVALAVVTFPTWVERQSMARLAAQEAARTVVLASDGTAGVAAAAALVGQIAVNHGLPASDVALAVDGTLTRGGAVTAAVTVAFPAAVFPGFGTVGAVSWTVRHTEQVDAYRSFP